MVACNGRRRSLPKASLSRICERGLGRGKKGAREGSPGGTRRGEGVVLVGMGLRMRGWSQQARSVTGGAAVAVVVVTVVAAAGRGGGRGKQHRKTFYEAGHFTTLFISE